MTPLARRTLAEQKQREYGKALDLLEQAKTAYELGFFEGHAKVAWALEGMGKVHQKMGNLRQAQLSWDAAISIRRALQSRDNSKQMFSKELDAGTKTMSEIEKKRETIQNRFKSGGLKMALTGATGKSTGGNLLAKIGKSSKMLLADADAEAETKEASPSSAPMAYTDPASAKKPLLSRT